MGGNICIIIRENCKMVFRQGAYAAVSFLFLVPFLYGIPNLNGEKAADCLGKLVAFIGIPLFVSILKPEQDSEIRDVILIKEFPYCISIFLRIIFASLLSAVLIWFFSLYMLYQGCEFPIGLYTVRTVALSLLIGGAGLLGSVLFRSTMAGFLLSVGFVFLFYENFAGIVFGGVPGFVVAAESFLYGIVLLLCDK